MAATLAAGMIFTSATFSSGERSQPTTRSHGSGPLVGRRWMWRMAIAWRDDAGAERIGISMNGMDMTVVEDTTCDDTDRMVATGASRRTALRSLAAGLLALAGGAIATDSLAKKRKRKRKKKGTPKPQPTPDPRPQSACSEVTSIAFINVPSDGSIVETPVLKKGQIYHLRAEGWWAQGGEYANDAYARYRYHADAEYNLYENGVRLGISVNGQSPDLWGHSADPDENYKLSHRYTMALVGKDAPATLRVQDSNYNDNSRDLYVDVVCIPIS
jgi:hypothetical protein